MDGRLWSTRGASYVLDNWLLNIIFFKESAKKGMHPRRRKYCETTSLPTQASWSKYKGELSPGFCPPLVSVESNQMVGEYQPKKMFSPNPMNFFDIRMVQTSCALPDFNWDFEEINFTSSSSRDISLSHSPASQPKHISITNQEDSFSCSSPFQK